MKNTFRNHEENAIFHINLVIFHEVMGAGRLYWDPKILQGGSMYGQNFWKFYMYIILTLNQSRDRTMKKLPPPMKFWSFLTKLWVMVDSIAFWNVVWGWSKFLKNLVE